MSLEGNAQQSYSPIKRTDEHADAFRRLSDVNHVPATAAGWFSPVRHGGIDGRIKDCT